MIQLQNLKKLVCHGNLEELSLDSCKNDNLCSICHENIIIKKYNVRKMCCGHTFHGNCIDKWLKRSHLCPLCRTCVI